MDGKNALYFCGGVVLGIAGTIAFQWFWEAPEQTDIPEEQEETVAPEKKPSTVDKSTLDAPFEAPKQVDYSSVVNGLYTTAEVVVDDNADPRRITEQTFMELSSEGHYDTHELTLYSDGILADSVSDNVMSESDTFAALGPNFTARKLQRIFALGSDTDLDAVFIRNDRLYTLYEVTIDDRTYKEVTGGGD